MLYGKGLVVELVAVNRLAAGAIASSKVTTLDHELLDDAVEDGALVVQRLSGLSNALLACAEGAEVLGRLGNEVGVELHGDTADGLAAEGDIKVDAGSRGGVAFGRHCGILIWAFSVTGVRKRKRAQVAARKELCIVALLQWEDQGVTTWGFGCWEGSKARSESDRR